MTDPKKFADLLANSSLRTEDKIALLKLLPSLDMKTIAELTAILGEDVEAQETAISEAEKMAADLLAKIEA